MTDLTNEPEDLEDDLTAFDEVEDEDLAGEDDESPNAPDGEE